MTQQTIDVGAAANDGTGDYLRDAFIKANDNFDELYAALLTFVLLSGSTMTGALILNGDPSTALQAATKQYVDNVAAGLDVKPSVRCATTANITLSGEQTIDAVTTSASRVLVKDQSAPAQNGIYVTAAGAWSRAADMDAWTEVPGANVWVEQGTTNGDTAWVCTADTGGTIGTTAMPWMRFGGSGVFQAASTVLSFLATAGSADAAGLRTLLGLVIGTNVQAYNATLAALAALSPAADRLAYFTGSSAMALATLTSFARTLLDDADAAEMRGTIGVRRRIPSGRYMAPDGVMQAASAGAAGGADSMRGFPGHIREAITIANLGLNVTTAAASGNVQIAVYAADAATLAPTGSPLATTGSLSTAATGGVEATGLSLAIGPGVYWFFTNCDASAATAVFASSGAGVQSVTSLMGSSTIVGAAGVASKVAGAAKSQSFGSWPTLTGSFSTDSLSDVTTQSIPFVVYKI